MAPHTSQIVPANFRGGPKKKTKSATITRLEKVYWWRNWSRTHKADPMVALA